MRKIFIDAGSHYGEGLMDFNRSFGLSQGWEIHSFEPNPNTNTKAAIEEQIKDWTSKIEFHKKAIYIKDCEIEFFCSSRDAGEKATWWTKKYPECYEKEVTRDNDAKDGVGSFIITHRNTDLEGEYQKIPAISLRNFIDNLGLVDDDFVYIKMDIEGSEYAVIPDILESENAHFIKKIFCELHDSSNLEKKDLKGMVSDKGIEFHLWS